MACARTHFLLHYQHIVQWLDPVCIFGLCSTYKSFFLQFSKLEQMRTQLPSAFLTNSYFWFHVHWLAIAIATECCYYGVSRNAIGSLKYLLINIIHVLSLKSINTLYTGKYMVYMACSHICIFMYKYVYVCLVFMYINVLEYLVLLCICIVFVCAGLQTWKASLPCTWEWRWRSCNPPAPAPPSPVVTWRGWQWCLRDQTQSWMHDCKCMIAKHYLSDRYICVKKAHLIWGFQYLICVKYLKFCNSMPSGPCLPWNLPTCLLKRFSSFY